MGTNAAVGGGWCHPNERTLAAQKPENSGVCLILFFISQICFSLLQLDNISREKGAHLKGEKLAKRSQSMLIELHNAGYIIQPADVGMGNALPRPVMKECAVGTQLRSFRSPFFADERSFTRIDRQP